jgi:hypothetical protein
MRLSILVAFLSVCTWAAPVSLLIMDESFRPISTIEVSLRIGADWVRFPSDSKGLVHLFRELPRGTEMEVSVSGFESKKVSIRCPIGLPDCIIPLIFQVARITDEGKELKLRDLKVSKVWLDKSPRWIMLASLSGDRSVVYGKESFANMKVPNSWGGNFSAYAILEDGTAESHLVFINHYEREFVVGPKR